MYFGTLQLANRYLLSPLAGYTNLPFRLAVRELGGLGLATTDLVNARALLLATRKTLELIETCPEDRPLAVQIYGSKKDEMTAAAQWLENYGVQCIDINMGCPVDKVTKSGGGSAMMCNVGATVELVRAVVESVKLPVTVKMRLGWDESNLSAPYFAREFEQAGVAAVIIHGRTRAQGFSGNVSHDGIRAVVEAVARIPVVGNGDIRNIADARHMQAQTGCAGVSIGRGALLNPWIFAQLSADEVNTQGPSPTYHDRVGFMQRHFRLLVAQRGERFACLTFRKVAGWYCKVLKPGKENHQRLMLLERIAGFDAIAQQLLENGPPPQWNHEAHIAVPGGPVSHW